MPCSVGQPDCYTGQQSSNQIWKSLGSLTLELVGRVLSDPVNAWKWAMALHIVVCRFVVIMFREIILVVIPALKESRFLQPDTES